MSFLIDGPWLYGTGRALARTGDERTAAALADGANRSIAALTVRVERKGRAPVESLAPGPRHVDARARVRRRASRPPATDHGGAYELGAREPLPGIAVQPSADP